MKYEFVDGTERYVDGCRLVRIRALRDIDTWNVKAGELGGLR